jgi:hypothetical protein
MMPRSQICDYVDFVRQFRRSKLLAMIAAAGNLLALYQEPIQ